MNALAAKLDTPLSAPGFRREHLRDALGNAALEGLHPEAADLADLEKVIDGGLSGSQYLDRIKARYAVSA